MGYRLTKIYTRTGDDGSTGLGDGSRHSKADLRVWAMGEVDELNCHLGMLLAMLAMLPLDSGEQEFLVDQQHRLFDLGGEISMPGTALVVDAAVESVEARIDMLNRPLPPLKNFILPGGNSLLAQVHIARAVCRRAERCLVELAAQEPINRVSLHYVNRLSDYLFVLARSLAASQAIPETLWESGRYGKI